MHACTFALKKTPPAMPQFRNVFRSLGAAACLCLSAAALPLHAQSFFGEHRDGTLCRAGETIMFACDSRSKKIAVCARADSHSAFADLRYRFGTSEHLDLEAPGTSMPIGSYAAGNSLGDGHRGTLVYLSLKNGDTTYSVFTQSVAPDYRGEGAEENGGVLVEQRGKPIAKRMCDKDRQVLAGMMLDVRFFGVAVPRDEKGLKIFPEYRP